jgi:hypothetical protein
MRRVAFLAFVSSIALAACSGDSGAGASTKPPAELVNEATAAVEAKEWPKALANASAVLGDSRATAEEKSLAWPIRILAEANVNGVEGAKKAVADLGASGTRLEVETYRDVGLELANTNAAEAALEVLTIATAQHGSDPELKKKLKSLAKYVQGKLEESGDSAGLDKLKGLGYLSGSDDEEEEAAPAKEGAPKQ